MNTTGEIPCRSSSYGGAALSLTVALILQAFCWGFTVDDAWIVSRVAARGATTGLYSFNPGSPPTDAITPLGFAHILGVMGRGLGLDSPLQFWELSRWVGASAYGLSTALAGFLVAAHNGRRLFHGGAPLMLLTLPAAAWSGAGLATALVGLFVLTGAALYETHHRKWGAGLLGVAAAWRPELMPFSLAVLVTRWPWSGGLPRTEVLKGIVLMILPSVTIAVARFSMFDRFLPLSFAAKAPEPRTAIFYAAMTALWCGLGFVLLFREGAFSRGKWWAVPWCAHLVALVYAGGDWMPALRLSAPLMPWLVWAVGRDFKFRWSVGLAAVPAIGFSLTLALVQGEDLRKVADRRLALINQAEPFLRDASIIATVDVGWVGLASPMRIVDLAGVTDPRIALLPGGHTSKHLSPGLFAERNVDTWVIRALDRSYRPGEPLETLVPAYQVDARLLRHNIDLGFSGVGVIPLQGTIGQYVIARRSLLAARDPF